MEKVLESHVISKAQKSANLTPALCQVTIG